MDFAYVNRNVVLLNHMHHSGLQHQHVSPRRESAGFL